MNMSLGSIWFLIDKFKISNRFEIFIRLDREIGNSEKLHINLWNILNFLQQQHRLLILRDLFESLITTELSAF